MTIGRTLHNSSAGGMGSRRHCGAVNFVNAVVALVVVILVSTAVVSA
jgi:hypothetical protein